MIRTAVTPLPGRPRRINVRTFRRSLARDVAATALEVQNGATIRSPVATARMAQSINNRVIDPEGLARVVGTNVKSPSGYPYPRRQEYDQTLRHWPPVTRRVHGITITYRRGGEWGFLRKALAAAAPRFTQRVRRTMRRVFGSA